jgi:ATP-dependent DNA helicase RecQ
MNCRSQTHRQMPAPALVQQAVEFLRGDAIVLSPRLRWPKPVLAELPAGAATNTVIPPELRAQEGRALCLWGDAGWGREVAAGKYDTNRFSDALVEAAARLIRDRRHPQPAPEWVAAVPSLRRPELVRDFAQRLAARLGLPFLPVIQQVRDTQPQKQMENSVNQLRNLLGAFAVTGDIPRGPVLLVDDMTDSGWTLALLAVILQAHGSGPVHPFALAKSSPRET